MSLVSVNTNLSAGGVAKDVDDVALKCDRDVDIHDIDREDREALVVVSIWGSGAATTKVRRMERIAKYLNCIDE